MALFQEIWFIVSSHLSSMMAMLPSPILNKDSNVANEYYKYQILPANSKE